MRNKEMPDTKQNNSPKKPQKPVTPQNQPITSNKGRSCKPTSPDSSSSTRSGGNGSQKPSSPSNPEITKGGGDGVRKR
jgi:hypothetical protein